MPPKEIIQDHVHKEQVPKTTAGTTKPLKGSVSRMRELFRALNEKSGAGGTGAGSKEDKNNLVTTRGRERT